MSVRYLDWGDAWDKFVYVWVLVFGVCSMLAVVVCKEFADAKYAVWGAWIVGVPLASIFGFVSFGATFFWNLIFGHRESDDEKKFLRKKNHAVQLAWITGGIATVAAFFSHLNPWGVSKDFSSINVLDALITLILTFGIYKRQSVLALFLFLYFVLWKMPLWSELQPKSATFAGMIMALIFWRGFRAVLSLKKADVSFK